MVMNKKKKGIQLLLTGVLVMASTQIIGRFFPVADLLIGLIKGVGLGLAMIGLYHNRLSKSAA
jgi:hypothetical protein